MKKDWSQYILIHLIITHQYYHSEIIIGNSSTLIHHCGSPLMEIGTVPIKSLSKTEDLAEFYFEIWVLFEPETQ